VTAAAVAGVVLWGLAQPAFARLLWFGRPSSPELAQRVLRAEPWFADAARWQSLDLLQRPAWSWHQAAEALHWSGLATRLRPASHRLWSEYGVVNLRLVEELGGWSDAVDRARDAFGRATALEPHLAWHWLRWAQLERALGEFDRAVGLARRAVEEEPNFVRGWLFVARLELDRGRVGDAAEAFNRALDAHDRARWRTLSDYERDLVMLPEWQRDQLRNEISAFPVADLE
jgi:tetratricopeptide (TPR) repeat protein